MAEGILRLAVNLKGKNAKRFLEIKDKLGIRSGTDVLRWLINWYYESEMVKRE